MIRPSDPDPFITIEVRQVFQGCEKVENNIKLHKLKRKVCRLQRNIKVSLFHCMAFQAICSCGNTIKVLPNLSHQATRSDYALCCFAVAQRLHTPLNTPGNASVITLDALTVVTCESDIPCHVLPNGKRCNISFGLMEKLLTYMHFHRPGDNGAVWSICLKHAQHWGLMFVCSVTLIIYIYTDTDTHTNVHIHNDTFVRCRRCRTPHWWL